MTRDEEVGMAAKRALHVIVQSVKDVASELGVSAQAVTSWRSGRRTPSAENLRKIASLADEKADRLRGLAVEVRRAASERSTSEGE